MAAAGGAAEWPGSRTRHRRRQSRRVRGGGEHGALRRRHRLGRPLLRVEGSRRGRPDRLDDAAAEVAMVDTPTRSRVEGWMSGHLSQAALGLQRQADITGYTYDRARHAVDAVPWSGAGADGARAKLAENLARILDSLSVLNQAQRIATQGADAIDAAKRVVVEAIQNAVS